MIQRSLQALVKYLRTPVTRSADEFGDAIEEEIAFHIDARVREYIQSGMSEEEARQAAVQHFGNPSRVAVECHAGAIGGLILWHRLHLALTAVLVLAVGWLWLSSSRPIDLQQLLASQVPSGIAAMLDNDWTGDVQGQIVDDHGQSIENAHVLVVVKTWPDQSYFQRAYTAISGSDGRFLIHHVHPVDERYEVQIAAIADGRALTSSYYSSTEGPLDLHVLKLPPSSGFAMQIESEQGVRLTDVEVLPQGRVASNGTEHVIYFDSAQSLLRRTNNEGRTELPYFQPGDTANFLVRTANGKWKPHEVKVPEKGQIVRVRVSTSNDQRSEET